MSRGKLCTVLLIISILFGIKFLFPEQTGRFLNSASAIFEPTLDYREIFSRIGEDISPVSKEKNETVPVQNENSYTSQELVETAVIIEAAWNQGERYEPDKADENEETGSSAAIPEAVTLFLESQEAFSEYALPDKVSYDYIPFPYDYAVPVSGYNSSGFGYRVHPIRGDVRFHYGTDFAAWTGENVYAFCSGTVSFAGYSDSYGNYITLEHDDGWKSLYAHCSKLCVSGGDKVETGQLIALVGETGLATGPHLHFELSHNGIYTNPEYYVD